MKKNYIATATKVSIILSCLYSHIGCLAYEGEFSPNRIDKIHEEDAKLENWLDKYIKDVLYVGMPIPQFIEKFTREESWADPDRPYIINNDTNKYIIVGKNGIKYRLTFKDGLLSTLEQYAWDKLPVVTAHYEDVTRILKGFNELNSPGFYDGMPEQEFIGVFSDSILSHTNDCYMIIGRNRRKYKVIFTNGYLSGFENLH